MHPFSLKKIVFALLVFITVFSSPQKAHASYSFVAATAGNTIAAKLSTDLRLSTKEFKLVVSPVPFSQLSTFYTPITETKPLGTDGTISWSIRTNKGAKTFYVRAEETGFGPGLYVSPVITVTTDLDYKWPLTVDAKGTSAVLSGKLNVENPEDYKIVLQVSKIAFPTPLDTVARPDDSEYDAQFSGSDGTYFFTVTTNPSTVYLIKQVITPKDGKPVLKTDKFNSTSGYIAEGSAAEAKDFAKRSYTLLAPLPGLSVLLDQDLCREQKLEGKLPAGSICNINDFINYAFRLLVGITAVFLVIRIMIIGYEYIVTDSPFAKASTKKDLYNSLGGLALALCAYLILNTINPKLVENDVGIETLALNTETYTTIDSTTYQKLTGQNIKPKKEYVALVDSLSQKNGIDTCIVKASITVESAWVPNIIGCDENAHFSDVPSRQAFIQSGIKYDGTTFTDTNTNNNCPKSVDTAKPGYGLDWRFSKGGGLMQKTLFPRGYKSAAWYSGVKQGGTYWNNRTIPFSGWEKLIVPEANIQSGIDILKTGLKCGTIEQAYRVYGSGSCNGNGPLINASVAKKMNEYTICKSGAAQYK